MKPTESRTAIGWLASDAGFRSLAERADRLLSLQEDLRRCVPGMDLIAMGLERETLLVGTTGAAAAAKLRQLEPSIVAALRARGWTLNRVRFRPRSRGAGPGAAPFEPRAEIPASALHGFAEVRDQASSESLKRALTDLLRRHARR